MKRQDGTQPAIDENHPYKSFQKASPAIEDDEFPPYATANIGKELCTAWKID